MTGVRLLRRSVVIGGAGAVGGLFAEALKASGAAVTVADPAVPADPADPGAGGDATDPGPALIAELRAADLVLLAVPERTALAALPVLAPHLRPGALLADTLSVKRSVVPALRAVSGVEAVSLNPMFAPSLGFPGRPVAAVVVRDGPAAAELLRLLAEWGARPVPVGAGDHDRLAAASQALTHAAVLGFGVALTRLGVGACDLAPIAPPPHRALLALLARVASGTPEVYWDVQAANPNAPDARKALAEGIRHVADLVDDGDEAGFEAVFGELRAFFGGALPTHADLCARMFDGLPPSEET
ncbi:prephenate dehydrogenase/arogenate dehydrogenase family protein [Bailinhaonella thermotolerans]|uniref:Prephenate dehydrogenase n=1 Tax=Bailinhaonella thermotolerans TaxID=1070861 RepID=A0A3A4B6Y9_9ACTN|nr:prephenate dehydrogenase/arogenate dehydrogenase family protein [Bailinhaonella thermotolerans]RJL34337.1 prephenate dehydrogenase [Bailinhaonella thermotolerans]